MAYIYGTCTTGSGSTDKYETRISYSYTQDQSANTSTITAILQARANNSSYMTQADFYRSIDNSGYTHSTTTIGGNTTWVNLKTYTWTIPHADDGTLAYNVSGDFYQSNVSGIYALYAGVVSGPVTFTTIPRYAAITSFTATVNSPSTVSCSWATDKSCSAVYYSIDNGTTYSSSVGSGTSGSFTISGLTPGQTYPIKLKVKATDSGLETPTQTALSRTMWSLSTTTFASFNLGTTIPLVTATITRASTTLSHDIAIYVKNPDSSTYTLIKTYPGIVTTTQDISFTSGELDTIYNLIPTKTYVHMRLTTTTKIGSTSYGTTNSSVQNAYVIDANPSFTDFEYIDTNTTTTTITGDPSKFIKGYSNAQITVSVAKKASAQKGATMSTYSFENAGLTTPTPKAYSDVADVVETLNGIQNSNLVVRATDSRGNNTAKTKTIGTFINYTVPVISSKSITRTNNVDDETTLAFSGTYNNWTGLSQSNSIQHAKYRYRETGGTWSSYSSDLTLTTNTGGSFSYSGTIAGDLGVSGFDTTKSFEIEIVITDRLASVTPTNMTLNSAQPLLWKFKGLVGGVLKSILGIGKKPDTTLPHGSIDIAGDIKLAGNLNGIDIIDLDNVTKFLSATAVTNGDYKVNISNTLTTNMFVYLYLPNATTSTQTARLSIDDGSTYKNIKLLRGANTLTANYIQNNFAILRYNGTDWIWVNTNLVAVYISSGGLNNLTASNLSSAIDGTYRVVVSGSFSETPSWGFRVNNISTDGAYFSNTIQASGTLTTSGSTTVSGYYQESTMFFFGNAGTNKLFNGSFDFIVQGDKVVVNGVTSCNDDGFQFTSSSGGYLNSTVTDISSIALRNTSGNATMVSGTKMEIYRLK